MVTRGTFGFPVTGWTHPLNEMERLRREMDLLTRAIWGGSEGRLTSAGVYPLVNITEDEHRYYVRAELPGLKADDMVLQAHGRKLTIAGERKIPSEGDQVKYHRREREAGKFSRIIELPGEINGNQIDAKLVNGLLTVVIEKAEAAKPKQITVK